MEVEQTSSSVNVQKGSRMISSFNSFRKQLSVKRHDLSKRSYSVSTENRTSIADNQMPRKMPPGCNITDTVFCDLINAH